LADFEFFFNPKVYTHLVESLNLIENQSMTFYSSITDYYDLIFPFKPAQLNFVIQSIDAAGVRDGTERVKTILDIGCATGSLAGHLAEEGFHVTATDFDKGMIAAAKTKAAGESPVSGNIVFKQLDMRKIGEVYGNNQFDALTCFGNTLVHLTDPDSIADFLLQAGVVLKPEGILLLQVINYDRILNDDIKNLSTIENNDIRFERQYEFETETGLINFKTSLTDKNTGLQLHNSVFLYPLRKNELTGMLDAAGFARPEFFGTFIGGLHTPKSVPLILRARKLYRH
jgi:glycine/sarcosine N-methyltransferase